MDRLAALEQRMNILLTRLEECKTAIATLTDENTNLRAQNKDVEALRKENRQITVRVNQLEKELKVHGTRGADIKLKIKAAIQRIDTLESDVARL